MTDDPFNFIFDKTIGDTGNGVRVDVTVVDPDADVQISLRSGAIDIPFFLKPYYARMLATYLLQACDARDKAVGEFDTTGQIGADDQQ